MYLSSIKEQCGQGYCYSYSGATHDDDHLADDILRATSRTHRCRCDDGNDVDDAPGLVAPRNDERWGILRVKDGEGNILRGYFKRNPV